ncbi:MAG: ABC transporter ATP-binding protein [Lachnospiraceae bacterium]|nr:ABC transporter ATP-binding protein [Lachnospiraceae bacterium]
MELIAENVNKIIDKKNILNDVSLKLRSGMIYGFVGRNGSGKTMLFRALSGLMSIDSGTVSLDGKVLHKDFDVLPDLGIMIENAGLYPQLSGFDNLKRLSSIRKKAADDTIREYIRTVGLDPDDKKPFRKYSLGMKQRLVFAQAIFEDQKILMLDEPTNAMDDSGVQMVRDILLERKKDSIILIASHNREDIDLLADIKYRVSNGQFVKEE